MDRELTVGFTSTEVSRQGPSRDKSHNGRGFWAKAVLNGSKGKNRKELKTEKIDNRQKRNNTAATEECGVEIFFFNTGRNHRYYLWPRE